MFSVHGLEFKEVNIMMRSMYSGVSGLAIHQSKMDVIGNNIANVNTLAFKASRVTFAEVFSQTMANASGPGDIKAGTNPMQIGLGAGVNSIDVSMREGSSQRTDNPLDIKIKGPGFFVVRGATGNKFTRAGAFIVDEAGNLANTAGMKVMGWPVNEEGTIEKGKVSPLQIMSPNNISSEPTTTKIVTIAGNINSEDKALTEGVPFTSQFFDSLGRRYTATFEVTKVPGTGTTKETYPVFLKTISTIKDGEPKMVFEAGKANPSVSPQDGAGAAITDTTPVVTLSFDSNGKVVVNNVPVAKKGGFKINVKDSSPGGPGNPVATFGQDDPDPTKTGDILFDFTNLTLFAGNTTIESTTGDEEGKGSGAPAGVMSGFEVDGSGIIIGKYTNGATKQLGQIVVANFQNPEGLKKVGDNLFEATNNSGDFDGIGEDITSAGGAFSQGVLEMSNVDLSREFTEMITTQRGFQANSRIITSSDEMLQELVNLKR